jgi:hypothetical protein
MDPVSGEETRSGHGSAVTLQVICDELARRGLDAAPLLHDHGLPVGPWSPLARFPRRDILAFVDACMASSGDSALHQSSPGDVHDPPRP